MNGGEDLGVRAGDSVGVAEQFGQMAQRLGGIAGTLHITDPNMIQPIAQSAWDLSGKAKKPVIIVVRNPER